MDNNTVLGIWSKEAFQVLKMAYPDASDRSIHEYIGELIISPPIQPIAQFRNIYKLESYQIPINEIPGYVQQNNLIIGANGSFSDHPDNNPSVVSMELISLMADRKRYKDLMKKAIDEKDDEARKMNNIFQNFVKIVMNSFYGIQLQAGSYLFNPDSASFITVQSRNLIAEMLWSLEQFFGSNFGFINLNEFYSFIKFQNEQDVNHEWDEFIEFHPSIDDIVKYYENIASAIPGYDSSKEIIRESLYTIVQRLTEPQRDRLFYKGNLKVLLEKNPKVFQLFKEIVLGSDPFITPEHIPENYKRGIDIINHICDEFVTSMCSNSNRVTKFLKNKRRVVLNSDTDSVFVHLGNWVDWFNEKLGFPLHHDEDDDQYLYRVVNLLSSIGTHMQDKKIKVYCENARVPKEFWKYIEMKNEFLFKRQLAYPVKKNYAIWKKLQEGKIIDDVDYTGLKLNGSRMSRYVKDILNDIIENDILRKDLRLFNPMDVWRKVKETHAAIQVRLKAGDMSLGSIQKYSGEGGYKAILQEATGRGCLIWNLLNENDPIVENEKCYRFDTTLATEEDLVKITDKEVREKIRTKIFHNPQHETLNRYGLTKICMPMYGYAKVIPEWLIPFLDTRSMADKHMEPITSLLPSLNWNQSKTASFTRLIPL